MSKKLLFIGIGFILATFALGWEAAMMARPDEFKGMIQALPIIRFERFDEARRTLIIGLFNPGAFSIEISRTKLLYEANNKIASTDFVIKEYGDRPLVLDPGDTILVPLANNLSVKPKTETGIYCGQLDFKIPGKPDFYSVYHRFSASQLAINNPVKNRTQIR